MPQRLTRRRRPGGWTLKRPLIGLLCLGLLPLTLASCNQTETTEAPDTRVGTAPAGANPTPVSIGELLDEPGRYTGQTVTVSGEVNDILGPKAFSIGGEEFLPPGELLVVSPQGFPQLPDRPENEHLVDDDIVQVTGTVRNFILTEVQRDVEPGDLEGEVYAEWEGKPVLVVTRMITTPRARPGGMTTPGTTDPTVTPGTPGTTGNFGTEGTTGTRDGTGATGVHGETGTTGTTDRPGTMGRPGTPGGAGGTTPRGTANTPGTPTNR